MDNANIKYHLKMKDTDHIHFTHIMYLVLIFDAYSSFYFFSFKCGTIPMTCNLSVLKRFHYFYYDTLFTLEKCTFKNLFLNKLS